MFSLGNALDLLEGVEPSGIELFCDGTYPSTWNNVTCGDCAGGEGEKFDYYYRAYDFRNEVHLAILTS